MIAANTCTEKISNDSSNNLILGKFRLLNDQNKARLLYAAEKILTMNDKEFNEARKDIEAFYNQIEAEMDAIR